MNDAYNVSLDKEYEICLLKWGHKREEIIALIDDFIKDEVKSAQLFKEVMNLGNLDCELAVIKYRLDKSKNE